MRGPSWLLKIASIILCYILFFAANLACEILKKVNQKVDNTCEPHNPSIYLVEIKLFPSDDVQQEQKRKVEQKVQPSS